MTTTTPPRLRLITPSTSFPVTTREAKAFLRIDHDDEDEGIFAMIQAATSLLDGRTGLLGRALEPATYELALDAFPSGAIHLPFGPVAGVTGVLATGPNGVEATVSEDSYEVDAAPSFEGWVVPVSGFSWPATMATVNAVTVRFIAGTGTPSGVKQAILAMVASRYDDRTSKLLTPGIVSDLAGFRRPVLA